VQVAGAPEGQQGNAEGAEEEDERNHKFRIDRLYLVFTTPRRWDINRIFAGLDWS
jgi:hypothetical protein